MNLDKSLQNKILHIRRKIEKINYLGGKCIVCGETNPFILCFHHKFDKEFGINKRKTSNLETIKLEIDKCDLMCNNCHIEIHYLNSDSKSQWSKNKVEYLKWINCDKCIRCGYDKCNQCLDFHHIDNKLFKISSIRNFNLEQIKDKINNELSKCIVLCKNCHILEHSNYNFYLKNKELVDNYKKRKISKKLNRSEVKFLYESGMTQKEISEILLVGKSTISNIIKELRIKPR